MSGRCWPPAPYGSFMMKMSPGCMRPAYFLVRCCIASGNAPSCRERQSLRDHLPVPVAERGRVIHRVAHHRRIGAAHEHERHLVGDRRERVLHHLERDWIDAQFGVRLVINSGSHGAVSICMLPCPSSWALAPGGMTQVASSSSMIIGPGMRFASAARLTTGVSCSLPSKYACRRACRGAKPCACFSPSAKPSLLSGAALATTRMLMRSTGSPSELCP